VTRSEIPAVEQLAKLARLRIDRAEAERLRVRLEALLGHFEAIQTIDTEGVTASPYAVEMTAPVRSDLEVGDDGPDGRAIVAALAPEREGDEYRVPPVL